LSFIHLLNPFKTLQAFFDKNTMRDFFIFGKGLFWVNLIFGNKKAFLLPLREKVRFA